ncbi:MAG TPA: thiolase family protein [Rhizomicrobium sp.]|nr:thiolase family protein [Rhizomicrobium sp.]
MSPHYVIGVGMTRFGKLAGSTVKSLARAAIESALADAGAKTSDVEAAFYANTTQGALEGQLMIGGQIVLRGMGIQGIPVTNVENACASGATAFHLAQAYLKAGLADVVLAVGVDKMHSSDKARSAAVFNGGWDVQDVDNIAATLKEIAAGANVPDGREAGGNSIFMDLYASLAKAHMRDYGTSERQLATVASKNHNHSTFNPLSQYQLGMSVEEVLAARMIAWPLTLPMCAPISDGAAAALLCNETALKRFPAARPIRIRASVLASGVDRQAADAERHICRIAARKAYDMAGAGPEDMSVAEVHDASAFAEIVQSENLGFCEIGQGGWLAEKMQTALGGKIPINPSGGLESKGHPIGATGLGQIHELTLQLRGAAGGRQVEGARLAIAENGGGFYGVEEAAACITILGG